ncbi:MAG: toprim domain-containing protein [Betaproteobacteria bacterium]|nr:toprim domain-containing protein [Betaproteobacteria bacterium]
MQDLPQGEHRLPCPECAKSPHDKTLGVTVDHDGGVYHCFRCGAAGAWRNDQAIRSTAPSRPLMPKVEKQLTLAANWRQFWRDLRPISGTARKYLDAHQCVIPPADGDLRCTESLRHPSRYVGPALVALVTDALTREPLTLHRTWIRGDGTKAPVEPPRLLLGKHRKQGGVIRLWSDDSVSTSLAIAEGIESALSLATVRTPVWSLIDAGNLGAFQVLDGVEDLSIFADHDAAGLRAADECAERWRGAGRHVGIAKSPVPSEDANDVLRRTS